jgi:hypothetical protein
LCFNAGPSNVRLAYRHISTEVLHNTPDAAESFNSAGLIEEVVPLRALQFWTAPVFFGGSRLWHGSCGQVLCVRVVDGEFENADVMV